MNIFETVSVNVEDWGVNGFGEIGAIYRTSSLKWSRSETNLVVDDNVNCATHGVICQILHLHGFIDNTLTREGGITMNQNRNNLLSSWKIGCIMLIRSHLSHDNRVDTLQMRRISKHFNGNVFTVNVLSEAGAQVIFNITLKTFISTCSFSKKFTKDCLEWFAHHIC